jgi:Family of unknown function (DUF5941)
MTALVGTPPDPIAAYRDDGPLARALGRAVGPSLPLPGAALIVGGLAPLLVVAIVRGGEVSYAGVGVVLAWLLLTAGASAGAPDPARMRWETPPLMRTAEYAGLIWIAALHGASAYPGAFALIAALTFRHYDLVYRRRDVDRIRAFALGWDGRLMLGYLLLVAGALPAGFYVMAIVLGAVFVADAVIGLGGEE